MRKLSSMPALSTSSESTVKNVSSNSEFLGWSDNKTETTDAQEPNTKIAKLRRVAGV